MNKRVVLLALFSLLLTLFLTPVSAQQPATTQVRILAVNDFHGNLEPPTGSAGQIESTEAGGVEYLATHLNRLRANNPNTVVVSAGDLIGASPLVSALFHDEPTIAAFNQMGLDFNANAAGESALGDVSADAQLAATADPALGGAVLALMNPGGIRADLHYPQSKAEGDGLVSYEEAFTVQPFGNSLVTLTLTGAQLKQLLEQQFNNPQEGQNRILQVSDGFSYTWSASAPAQSQVSNMVLDGAPIDPTANYRITVNSFLADGGDNFTVFKAGSDRLGGALDLDALESYFKSHSPIAPGLQNRITVQ